MELREYQVNLINKVKGAWLKGFKYPCIVAPCGAGKTIILSEMAKKATLNKKRVMFIVHRKELCDQTENTFRAYGVDMNYCNIYMVQTVSRHLEDIEKPDLILIDENHHCKASTYRKIFNKYDGVYRIGVTATPIRLDGKGFEDVNDILVEEVTTKWLIQNNYLSPAKLFSAQVIDLTNVAIKRGEYDVSQCEELLTTDTVYGDVLNTWREKADGKQTIAYCVSVNHSKYTAEMFNNNGIKSEHIDGETPKKQREEIISKFRSGEITILCNCDIVSEGFDVPDCEAVILLRPTQSLTLFIQQSMRCMRYKKDKQAVIIDHVANVFRFGLPWIDRQWSLKGKTKDRKKQKIEDEVKCWTCNLCYCTWEKSEGRICPDCGEEIPISEREIKVREKIKLIEVTEEMFKKSRKEIRKELKRICEERGYKKGWVYYQIKEFDEKEKKKIEKMKEEIVHA